jgi:hypothetical protein
MIHGRRIRWILVWIVIWVSLAKFSLEQVMLIAYIDNRAQSAGGINPQRSSNVPGNTASQEQPHTSGVDNHLSSEDDYNKSTEETKSQSRPTNYDPRGQQTSEESHHTATHEHKSHSATTHNMPCQSSLQNEQGTDS